MHWNNLWLDTHIETSMKIKRTLSWDTDHLYNFMLTILDFMLTMDALRKFVVRYTRNINRK